MSDQYFIGIEDLDRVISKSFMDGKEDVRLEFMALRDVAIERMIKADHTAVIETDFGTILRNPYFLGEVDGLIERSSDVLPLNGAVPVPEVQFWHGKQSQAYDSERLPATGDLIPWCKHCYAELLGNQIFCPICGVKQ